MSPFWVFIILSPYHWSQPCLNSCLHSPSIWALGDAHILHYPVMGGEGVKQLMLTQEVKHVTFSIKLRCENVLLMIKVKCSFYPKRRGNNQSSDHHLLIYLFAHLQKNRSPQPTLYEKHSTVNLPVPCLLFLSPQTHWGCLLAGVWWITIQALHFIRLWRNTITAVNQITPPCLWNKSIPAW